ASLLTALLLLGWLRSGTPVKPGARVVFEGESIYQFVQVVENNRGWRRLQLNEGVVVHSWYRPGEIFTYGEWDYFALGPLFTPAPCRPDSAQRWALIGAGAGTTARLLAKIYGNVAIDGIELDPLVAETGRLYFGEQPPGYRVTVQDGRAWLTLNRQTYDVIGIDAYRQPYIPFELTTVECFRQVRDRLSTNGVVAMNVVHLPGDDRLVGALVTTLRQVFPSIHVIHLGSRQRNSIVFASCQPVTEEDFFRNIRAAGNPRLRVLGERAMGRLVRNIQPGPVLTDDCAPVEKLMDLMLLKYIMTDSSVGKNAERGT
ncbi:MAG: fused MFS/spermidine synthase, partial [bacterium]